MGSACVSLCLSVCDARLARAFLWVTVMITELSSPAVEPVSLASMKQYLRIDYSDEDVFIGMLIRAARRTAEHITGRVIAERTFRVDESSFFGGVLPMSPVSAIASVRYLDPSKVLQTLSGIDFCPHPVSPQFFPPASGWPSLATAWNAVQVTCTAGMNPVPEDIQNWIMLRVSMAYENREPIRDVPVEELPRTYVDALLDPYVVVRV